MTATLAPVGIQDFFIAGTPATGGKLFTYAAGTNTKQNTYTDQGALTVQTNPIILNARGEPQNSMGQSVGIWLDPTLSYKFVLSPSTDTDPPTNPISTVDNINGVFTTAGITYSFQFATTVALLAAFGSGVTLPDGVIAITAGRTTADDNLGGTFRYDAGDTTTANNGGNIRVDGQNRRWYQVAPNLTVTMFGAVGTADDTAVVQAAINAAATQSVNLWFPPGIYTISTTQIALVSGVTLKGPGSGAAVIRAKAQDFTGLSMVIGTSVTDVIIDGLTFDATYSHAAAGPSSWNLLAFVTSARVWIQNCEFIGIKSLGVGVVLNGGTRIWITDNYFEMPSVVNTFSQAINISASAATPNYIKVSRNICNGTGIDSDGSFLFFDDNIVYNVKFGAGIAGGGSAVSGYAAFRDNFVYNCTGTDSNGFAVDGIQAYFPGQIISGNWCGFNGGNGILFGGNMSNVTDNICIGNGIVGAGRAGILNAYAGAAGYQNGTDSLVSGNLCYDPSGAGGTQSYGYLSASSSISGEKIYANDFDNNKTANQSIVGTSPSFIGNNYQASGSWTPGTINSGAAATTTVTVGCSLGWLAQASFSLALGTGVTIAANCSSANTVTVNITNVSGSPVTLGAGTVRVTATEPAV